MVFSIVILIIGFLVLLIGSFTDIRTREVPDWVDYGLIFAAIGARLAYSLATFDWSYLIEGILGFIAFFIIAYVMFYAGQWGGGDAKMMMGMGALVGMRLEWLDFSVSFIVNIFLVGAVYGLVWTSVLAFVHRHKFWIEVKKIVHSPKMLRIRKMFIISALIMIILAMFAGNLTLKLLLFAFVAFYLGTFYLWIFIKAVEKTCMYKFIPPEKLTEGDWIAKNIVVGGKRICGPKDLGIEMSQIRQLIKLKRQKKIDKILIKEGIPFVPSFLIAFVATYLFGNMFLMVV